MERNVNKARILVIDDEFSIADAVLYALSQEGMDPVWVSTGTGARQQLDHEIIALAVVDVGLPDCNGFDFARDELLPRGIPFLFLTARSDEIDRVVGLELGGDDYITKPFSPRELAARVKNILRRTERSSETTEAPPAKDHHMALQIDDLKKSVLYYGEKLDLSKSEYGIIKLLSSRPGQVYSREQLLLLCWDEPGMSTERTVDSHIKNLRKKMKAVRDKEAIITHRGLGYSLAERL